ncbi:MAG TPA: 30S ribosomal protein S20 [Gemmataceae bacterium]|nr:30S ribosomal protein S20 [Gemmataceae bacterium]
MPHTRSAKKQLRKNQKRRLRNRATMKALKTQLKKVAATSSGGTLEDLRKEYTLAAKKLDKAAAKRVIHPNMAARKKSQLARLLYAKEQAAKSAPAAPATPTA